MKELTQKRILLANLCSTLELLFTSTSEMITIEPIDPFYYFDDGVKEKNYEFHEFDYDDMKEAESKALSFAVSDIILNTANVMHPSFVTQDNINTIKICNSNDEIISLDLFKEEIISSGLKGSDDEIYSILNILNRKPFDPSNPSSHKIVTLNNSSYYLR